MSFSRKDLKTGMIVTTRNGVDYVVLLGTKEYGDIIWNPINGGYLKLLSYTDDLRRDYTNEDSINYDIVEVKVPSVYGIPFENIRGKVVFQGNKTPPVKVGDKLYNVYCSDVYPHYEVLFIHENGKSFFVEKLKSGQPSGETTVLNEGEAHWIKK